MVANTSETNVQKPRRMGLHVMRKKQKIRGILIGNELLRIESIHRKVPKWIRYTALLIISIGYILALLLRLNEEELWLWVSAISVLYVLILVVVVRMTNEKNPFIVTEKGIVVDPYLAEVWEDIEGYGWETFKGLNRISLSAKERTCLLIVNKGRFQRNLENISNHSMLAQYGIFFNSEQMAETEIIFSQFGIRKIYESGQPSI